MFGKNSLTLTRPTAREQGSSSGITPTTFVGGNPAMLRALEKAQLVKADSNMVLTGLPGGAIHIARAHRTGLLNLTSFSKVASSLGPARQGPSPHPDQPLAPPNHAPRPSHPEERGAPPQEPPQEPPNGQGVRAGIYRQAEATKAVRAALDTLADLDAEARGMPGGEPAQRPRLEALRQATVETMGQALRLALPELVQDGDPPAEAVDGLASRLATLDRMMRDGAAPAGKAYGIDKLIAALVSLGGLSERARSPVAGIRQAVVEDLSTTLDTLIKAVTPPRDGSALNPLIGQDCDLDNAIRGMRIRATAAVMARGHAVRHDGVPPDPAARARIDQDARQVVDNDISLIKMRRQAHRIMGGTAAPPLSDTVRIDVALVKGLRDTYGAGAKEIGVIIAGLMLAQRESLTSDGASRLLGDVRDELAAQRATLNDMRREHATALQERASLRRQCAPLRERLAEMDAQISAAINQGRSLALIDSLWTTRRTVIGDLDIVNRRLGSLEEQLTPLNEVEDHIQFLEQRVTSLIPEDVQGRLRLETARAAVDKRMGESALLHEERTRLQDQRDRLSAYRATVPGGAEREAIDDSLGAIATRLEQLSGQLGDVETQLKFSRNLLRGLEERFGRLRNQDPEAMDRYAEVALTGGLSQGELAKLGLGEAESRDILDTARTLTRQGLGSADQVARLIDDVNDVMAKIAGRLVDQAIGEQADSLGGGTNEAKAKRLGETLLQSITGTPHASFKDDRAMRQALLGDDERPGRLGNLLADNAPLAALRRDGEALQRLLVEQTGTSVGLDALRDQSRDAIRAFNAAHGGTRDVEHPQGLTVSRNLHQALRLLRENNGTMRDAPDAVRQRFAALCKSLAGFDPDTITVPFFQFSKPPLTEQQILAYGRDAAMMSVTKAILVLREQEPAMRRALSQQMSNTALALDRVIDQRQAAMGPETFRVVRDTIRAAILAVMPDGPGAVMTYNPADHIDAIKAKLESWGFPLDHCGPEVALIVGQSFGPRELQHWLDSTVLSPDLITARQTERQDRIDDMRQMARDGGRIGISAQTKTQLLDHIDQLQPGTKVKWTVGNRVEMQTGSIPVEPTGIVGVNVKLAVGSLDGIEIAMGGDGYELVLRDGWDGKLGGELSAKLVDLGIHADSGTKVSVGASLALEGAGYRVSGVAIRTPKTDEGRDAMKAILAGLLTQHRIEPRHLSRAQDIMPLVEWKGGVKVGIGARAGLDVKPGAALGGGGGIGVKVGASKGYSYTSSTSGNTNLIINKRDHEVTTDLSLYAGVSLTVAAPVMNSRNKPQSASGDLMGIGGTSTMTYKVKSKEVRGPDGLVQAGTEKVRQVMPPRIPAHKEATIAAMAGELFLKVRNHPRLDPVAREQIAALIAQAGSGDMVSISYALDDRVMAEVNRLLQDAKGLRGDAIPPDQRSSARERAEDCEVRAQALLDDDGSYVPSKVQLIPTKETLMQVRALDIGFLAMSRFVEGKGETVAFEVKLDTSIGKDILAGEGG